MNTGSTIALKQGLTIGIGFLILSTVALILISGGLLGMIGLYSVLSFNKIYLSLILLYISFPLALIYFGKKNQKNLIKGKSIIRTSMEFSFGVNIVIWLFFLFSQILFGSKTDILLWSIAIFFVVLILSLITTITIGLRIVKKTKQLLEPTPNST